MSAAPAEVIPFPEPTLGDGDGGPPDLSDNWLLHLFVRFQLRMEKHGKVFGVIFERELFELMAEYAEQHDFAREGGEVARHGRRRGVAQMTTTTQVALLRAGMTRAAAAASKSGPDILDGLWSEDLQTRETVINAVAPVLAEMAEDLTEEGN